MTDKEIDVTTMIQPRLFPVAADRLQLVGRSMPGSKRNGVDRTTPCRDTTTLVMPRIVAYALNDV